MYCNDFKGNLQQHWFISATLEQHPEEITP